MRWKDSSKNAVPTNGNVIKNLPERTIFIGRVRADSKFHHLPPDEVDGARGRKKDIENRLQDLRT